MTDFNTATETYFPVNDTDIFMNMDIDLQQIETRLGTFLYTSDDVYMFDEGLAGFKKNVVFAKSALPNLRENSSYGMLQSLEDQDLSFILFYPNLDDTQISIVAQKVRTIMKANPYLSNTNFQFSRSNIEVGFLVIIQNDANGKQLVSCVSDAPLVFLTDIKKAWQLVLS